MDKYFEIEKGSPIYNDYFRYLEEAKKMTSIFNAFAEKHGIEASEFIPRKKKLYILPTEKDKDVFGRKFTQGYGEYGEKQFKCNSDIGKDWVYTVQDMPIPHKPMYFTYGLHVLGRFSSRLFNIGENLYGSLSAHECSFELLECRKEMKASEFYKILESEKEKKNHEK
ncbi:hypothetical protein [Aminipila terrae]|uniref:Uncharacterized protein n=1 Tax=Aminipila terrae TaxID=2697030 RepID=A0A6P1MJQ4_9FIRM|nr:hypothetical protein [Aminipila terrae]QHI72874.1 hypothetical protein Ami3637_11070 [Aminipila terrae]